MKLIYQSSPKVTIASNIFVNVPVILQFEDTPLLEVVREQDIGFTTQIPVYHSDGTYLAKVKGNRVYATKEGEKANIKIEDHADKFICSLDKNVILELSRGKGAPAMEDKNMSRGCASAAHQGYFSTSRLYHSREETELACWGIAGVRIDKGKKQGLTNPRKPLYCNWYAQQGSNLRPSV